jgi:hypothetical protein
MGEIGVPKQDVAFLGGENFPLQAEFFGSVS